jgi:PTS system nitrogen regulatory IIA component|tara:strand:+ start:30 stop:494 length:465 start_codon:yes stop_codon:yes gene_type:complete
MKITDILKKEHIIENLVSTDKESTLDELSSFLKDKGMVSNKETLQSALMEREALGSTGIGENVAIPHAKISAIDQIVTVFGRSIKGIEFDSLDKKPVHFIYLVLAPMNSSGQHLKVLARISRLLKNKSLRESIISATEANQIYAIIADEDSKYI